MEKIFYFGFFFRHLMMVVVETGLFVEKNIISYFNDRSEVFSSKFWDLTSNKEEKH